MEERSHFLHITSPVFCTFNFKIKICKSSC